MIAHKSPYAELQVAGRPTVGHRTGSVADSPPTSNLPGGVFGQASRIRGQIACPACKFVMKGREIVLYIVIHPP